MLERIPQSFRPILATVNPAAYVSVYHSSANSVMTHSYIRITGLTLLGMTSCLASPLSTQRLAAQPANPARCQASVARAINRLNNVSNVQVQGRLQQSNLSQYYEDAPPQRPTGYFLYVAGNGDATVMRSTQFLTAISQDILRQCSDVGLVTISVYRTDWSRAFGVLKDGQVQEFRCIEPGIKPKSKWGEVVCP